MLIPSYLKPGDKVALISPSRYWEDNDAFKQFRNWVDNHGWELVLAPNIGKKFDQFGGTDEERISDIKWALENTAIKAVFAVRGGYGAIRLLPELENLNFAASPKWWVGFSDFTVIHHILQKQDVPSIHGPMPMQWNSSDELQNKNAEILAETLKGKSPEWKVDLERSNFLEPFSGRLIGGNLSIIYSLLAAQKFEVREGDVLLLEDIDEYLYHIDRMMQSLNISGALAKLKAVVVGSFSDMHDNSVPFGQTAEEIIFNTLIEYPNPIIFSAPIGHERKNYAVKLGMDCIFDGQFFKQP